MKSKYYILSLTTPQNDEYLHFLTNDEDLNSISTHLDEACVVFTNLEENKDLLYVPIELIKELNHFDNPANPKDIAIFNTPDNLDKLSLEYKEGALVRLQEQLYYALAVEYIDKDDSNLWFGAEDTITDELNKASLSTVCSDVKGAFIYLEKEKLDALCYTNDQGTKYIDNNRNNRKRLGLKYKDGVLQRSTGAGAEVAEDYVLMLEYANENNLTLPLLAPDAGRTIDLKRASTEEAPFHKETLYINKEKAESLATIFLDGSLVLLNTPDVLEALGLHYKEEKLVPIEDKEVEWYYVACLEPIHPGFTSLRFMDAEDQPSANLTKAFAYLAPLPSPPKLGHFVPVNKVMELASGNYLDNSAENIAALGLCLKEEVLSPIESAYSKEAEPKLEEGAEEKPKKEAPKEERVSYIGIAMKVWSLYNDIKKAMDQAKPKAPKPKYNTLNDLADKIHQVNKEKGFWDKERNVGEMLMLATSELGEAMEAHRKGKFADWEGYESHVQVLGPKKAFERYIKDSFEDEIADTLIRLFDMAAGLNIDLDRHIQAKLDYNRSRKRFHGKKY